MNQNLRILDKQKSNQRRQKYDLESKRIWSEMFKKLEARWRADHDRKLSYYRNVYEQLLLSIGEAQKRAGSEDEKRIQRAIQLRDHLKEQIKVEKIRFEASLNEVRLQEAEKLKHWEQRKEMVEKSHDFSEMVRVEHVPKRFNFLRLEEQLQVPEPTPHHKQNLSAFKELPKAVRYDLTFARNVKDYNSVKTTEFKSSTTEAGGIKLRPSAKDLAQIEAKKVEKLLAEKENIQVQNERKRNERYGQAVRAISMKKEQSNMARDLEALRELDRLSRKDTQVSATWIDECKTRQMKLHKHQQQLEDEFEKRFVDQAEHPEDVLVTRKNSNANGRDIETPVITVPFGFPSSDNASTAGPRTIHIHVNTPTQEEDNNKEEEQANFFTFAAERTKEEKPKIRPPILLMKSNSDLPLPETSEDYINPMRSEESKTPNNNVEVGDVIDDARRRSRSEQKSSEVLIDPVKVVMQDRRISTSPSSSKHRQAFEDQLQNLSSKTLGQQKAVDEGDDNRSVKAVKDPLVKARDGVKDNSQIKEDQSIENSSDLLHDELEAFINSAAPKDTVSSASSPSSFNSQPNNDELRRSFQERYKLQPPPPPVEAPNNQNQPDNQAKDVPSNSLDSFTSTSSFIESTPSSLSLFLQQQTPINNNMNNNQRGTRLSKISPALSSPFSSIPSELLDSDFSIPSISSIASSGNGGQNSAAQFDSYVVDTVPRHRPILIDQDTLGSISSSLLGLNNPSNRRNSSSSSINTSSSSLISNLSEELRNLMQELDQDADSIDGDSDFHSMLESLLLNDK